MEVMVLMLFFILLLTGRMVGLVLPIGLIRILVKSQLRILFGNSLTPIQNNNQYHTYNPLFFFLLFLLVPNI